MRTRRRRPAISLSWQQVSGLIDAITGFVGDRDSPTLLADARTGLSLVRLGLVRSWRRLDKYHAVAPPTALGRQLAESGELLIKRAQKELNVLPESWVVPERGLARPGPRRTRKGPRR